MTISKEKFSTNSLRVLSFQRFRSRIRPRKRPRKWPRKRPRVWPRPRCTKVPNRRANVSSWNAWNGVFKRRKKVMKHDEKWLNICNGVYTMWWILFFEYIFGRNWRIYLSYIVLISQVAKACVQFLVAKEHQAGQPTPPQPTPLRNSG